MKSKTKKQSTSPSPKAPAKPPPPSTWALTYTEADGWKPFVAAQPTEPHPVAPLVGAQKADSGKPRWDLLPFDALEDVVKVFTFGAKKYADHNYRKGMNWGRLLAAAFRHLTAWARGETLDEESKLPHLAHAACCILMLLALTKQGVGTDDRYIYPDTHTPPKE